jgi:catechol 2,3-dioxygenase-like lactoylglutathione lyase family enzyme
MRAKEKPMTDHRDMVSVRYMVDDVEKAVAFYTTFLGFEVLNNFPAFADIARGNLRLLISGPASSAARPMADGAKPGPGGWNRIHLIVDDIDAEVARLREAGAPFRNAMIEGPGGKQILLQDPSGNVVELFQMAAQTRQADSPVQAHEAPTLDHIAFNVPDLNGLVERLTGAFGMVAEVRSEHFALVADPGSGLKLELGQSGDAEAHFRHLGFHTNDVDGAHEALVDAGMEVSEPPHRRDFARMYTSFLKQPGGLEVQLVKYD